MNQFDRTSETSDPPLAGTSRDADVASRAHRPTVRRLLSTGRSRWIVAVMAMTLAAGLAVGVSAAPSATAVSSSGFAGRPGFGGGVSNARSAPAPGGGAGTVRSVSTSSFTMSTSAGQQVLVDEASSTTYQNRTTSITASGIATGQGVLVLGTASGTTITATQVIVEPAGVGGTASSSSSAVIPFKRGAPTTSKQEGQIPANWSQGSGAIVGGAAANKATEAALTAYPGGIVDRVVKLSNGEYNVHYIGVDWPHHVFVAQDFKVVGAE